MYVHIIKWEMWQFEIFKVLGEVRFGGGGRLLSLSLLL